MLSRITDKLSAVSTVRIETRLTTTNFDMPMYVHSVRLRWLGTFLRSSQNVLTFKAIQLQYQMDSPGNLIKNAPAHKINR